MSMIGVVQSWRIFLSIVEFQWKTLSFELTLSLKIWDRLIYGNLYVLMCVYEFEINIVIEKQGLWFLLYFV